VRHPTVDHVGLSDARPHGAQAGLHLRGHAALQAGQHRLELVRGQRGDDRLRVGVVRVEPLDVGEHHELRGVQRAGERRGGAVGVDVVDLAVGVRRDPGDDRDATRRDDVQHRVRVDPRDVTDQTDVDGLAPDQRGALLGREQTRVLPGQADGERPVGVDQPDELAPDLAEQHHPDDLHRLRGGDAQAAAELAGHAEPFQHRRDLRPPAVHDDRVDAREPQEHHVPGEGLLQLLVDHGVAAVLDDDDPAVEALQPGQRLGEHTGLLPRPLQPGRGLRGRRDLRLRQRVRGDRLRRSRHCSPPRRRATGRWSGSRRCARRPHRTAPARPRSARPSRTGRSRPGPRRRRRPCTAARR
jgi:hypothetical protein